MKGSLQRIANKRMEEIQDLSKQINFNNLSYHYTGKNDLKKLIGFKGLLNFNRSIKESNITLEKPEEQQREFKSESKKIVKGSKTSENQTSTAAVDTQHLKVEVVDYDFPNCIKRTCQYPMLIM